MVIGKFRAWGLQTRNTFKYWGWVTLLVFLLCSLVSLATAQGSSSIAQGFRYGGEGSPVAGTLVSSQPDNPETVEPSSLENADLTLGVVGQGSTLELSDDDSTLQVVRSGIASTLVSDINGTVKAGDRITASPIQGVGMRATENAVVVGVAQANLDDVEISQRGIADSNGEMNTVRIGLIPVQIETIFYAGQTKGESFVPGFVQGIADSIAGRQVSPVRVIVAAVLLLLLFISITVLLYSATKSSIISIGRNPLSEKSVRRSLLEVGITSIGILAFAAILIYLVLVV
jgi:hypothetical protein